MKDLKKAKNYLVAAYWNSTKSTRQEIAGKETNPEDALTALKNEPLSKKAIAKFNEYQGEYQKAIEELSGAIYLDSLQCERFGPEDPSLSQSYYTMGVLFAKKNDHRGNEMTMRYFDIICKIWFEFARSFIEDHLNRDSIFDFVELLTLKEGEKILENLKGSWWSL